MRQPSAETVKKATKILGRICSQHSGGVCDVGWHRIVIRDIAFAPDDATRETWEEIKDILDTETSWPTAAMRLRVRAVEEPA